MIESVLVQQLASLLAPALPYLMKPAAAASQKALEAVKGKIGDGNWNKAQQVWQKLQPWVEKKPELAESLKEVAENPDDPIARGALPRDLKKLLESMPTQTVNEIQNIVSQEISQTRTTIADRGGVAVGGSVSGGTINAGYHIHGGKGEE